MLKKILILIVILIILLLIISQCSLKAPLQNSYVTDDVVNTAGDTLSSVDDMTGFAKDAAGNVLDSVGNAVGTVGSSVDDIVDSAIDVVGNDINSGGDIVSSVGGDNNATINGWNQSESSKSNKFDKYTVVLGADEKMQFPGSPGELKVWIGNSSFAPNFSASMVQDKITVPAVGESAKVEAFAPAFKIVPLETQCIKIHPSGSEVRFQLIPEKIGIFNVSANIFLFDSLDCTGSPIPKTAATLKVTVEVGMKEIFLEKAKNLWNIFWEKLLEFWGAFVALIFSLIIFLIRGKIKRMFGFDNK